MRLGRRIAAVFTLSPDPNRARYGGRSSACSCLAWVNGCRTPPKHGSIYSSSDAPRHTQYGPCEVSISCVKQVYSHCLVRSLDGSTKPSSSTSQLGTEWGADNRGGMANCGSKCVATLAVHSLLNWSHLSSIYWTFERGDLGASRHRMCIITELVICSFTSVPVPTPPTPCQGSQSCNWKHYVCVAEFRHGYWSSST